MWIFADDVNETMLLFNSKKNLQQKFQKKKTGKVVNRWVKMSDEQSIFVVRFIYCRNSMT